MKSVDHFLRIGTSHKVCEDYIISGKEPFPFVILSDGCSSSKDTDMGARILTHIAKKYIIESGDYLLNNLIKHKSLLSNSVIYNSENITKNMGLNTNCLDATLLIAYSFNEFIYVFMYGDGFLFTIDLQDKITFYEILYNNNAPYYLSYIIDGNRFILYKESNPSKLIKTNDQEYSHSSNPSFVAEVPCVYYTDPFIQQLPINNYKAVFIASDGLSSFINKDGEKHNIKEILKEITSFKNTNGEFLKRRMGSKKGVINTFQEMGITHYDDLSIGGFII